MFASMKMVGSMLVLLRREFAIMQTLEKGSARPLLPVGCVQMAVQGGEIAEGGGNGSVQDFWLLFPVFESFHRSHQD